MSHLYSCLHCFFLFLFPKRFQAPSCCHSHPGASLPHAISGFSVLYCWTDIIFFVCPQTQQQNTLTSSPSCVWLYEHRLYASVDSAGAPKLGQEESLEQEVPHLHWAGQAGGLHVQGPGREARSWGGQINRAGWEARTSGQMRESRSIRISRGTQKTNLWRGGSDNLPVWEDGSGKGRVVPEISSGLPNEVRGERWQPAWHLQEWWVSDWDVYCITAEDANSHVQYMALSVSPTLSHTHTVFAQTHITSHSQNSHSLEYVTAQPSDLCLSPSLGTANPLNWANRWVWMGQQDYMHREAAYYSIGLHCGI